MKSDSDLFWKRVRRIDGHTACWPWLWAVNGRGYGLVAWGPRGKLHGAHRVAFFLANGRWPNVCRHKCNNKRCCNPAHLADGTHADNKQDALRAGAYTRRLTPDDARWARWASAYAGVGDRRIAAAFGVARETVRAIRTRRSWNRLAERGA
jgi:hypothetical protein